MFFAIAGVINILLALFHLTFWRDKDFNWQEELPKMNPANRGLIQAAVILFIPMLLSWGVISFLLAGERNDDSLSRAVIVMMGTFYVVRGAIQPKLLGLDMSGAIIMLICLSLGTGYFLMLL
jgi:hypothetical protein